MAHLRERYLSRIAGKLLSASPIVGIVGQRQTGKTTLVEGIAKEYVSLDDEEQLELARRSAKVFVDHRASPFAIDECQLSPALFPALKERVRVHRAHGQYILTGSVRFTSVGEIRESLTGRIIDLELLPLSLSELYHLPLTDIQSIAKAQDPLPLLRRNPFSSPGSVQKFALFLERGGLPGICFIHSESVRVRKMRAHIRTILDRDLRQVTRTTLDYLSLKTFLEEIALQQDEVFDLARAARGARIAVNTARKVLSALEAVFLVRVIHKEGDTSGRQVFLEDQGMSTFLLAERGQRVALHAGATRDWTRLLFQQLLAQVNYRDDLHSGIFSFRKRGGARIELGVRLDGRIVGYSVGAGQAASASQIRSAGSFQARFKNARVFLLHRGTSFRKLGDNLFEAPFGSVL